jgi:23S rRNA (cytidine1920-2'-O)/16S rRNA (cytidine1409-2'-O)-methyltransferase
METRHKKRKLLLDLLVDRSLVTSRAEGGSLIMAGKVIVDDQRVDKAGQRFPTDADIRIKDRRPFVSRAGEKIWGAIADLDIKGEFAETVVLDVGSSTGGFTDCVLQLGAASVIALDVGTNQLAWKLRTNKKVHCLEKTDIRDFQADKFPPLDWIVADVSFNSLSRLASSIHNASTKGLTKYLLLVKPQFELSVHEVAEGGVVTDHDLRMKAVQTVISAFNLFGVEFVKSIDSRVKGRAGNQEIFILLRQTDPNISQGPQK